MNLETTKGRIISVFVKILLSRRFVNFRRGSNYEIEFPFAESQQKNNHESFPFPKIFFCKISDVHYEIAVHMVLLFCFKIV